MATTKAKTRASSATSKAAKAVASQCSKPAWDLYQVVTDKIVAKLEQGVRPWQKSWTTAGVPTAFVRPLRHNGQAYRGLNTVLLWLAAESGGYQSPYWMTFKQTLAYKGSVKKGEKSTLVTYASKIVKTEKNDQGVDETKSFFVWKWFAVFNAEQCEGLPERFYVKADPEAPSDLQSAVQKAERISAAEDYLAASGAKITHGGAKAFYVPSADRIQLPEFNDFHDAEAYYATALHELVHWTGHDTRLKRSFSRFGDEAYAREELVAELGAAFLCADLAISSEPRDDHAAYLASWLKVLKNDKKFIFTAASQGQKAVGFLHDLTGFEVDGDAPGDVEDEVAIAA